MQGLDHIAVAVPDMEQAIANWQKLTGAAVTHREYVATQHTHVTFLQIGDFRIELLAGDGPDSNVAKFIEKRGPGLHHIAIRSEDGQKSLSELAQAGARLINESLRPGAERTLVGFAHPSSFGGVLVEIVEHPKHG